MSIRRERERERGGGEQKPMIEGAERDPWTRCLGFRGWDDDGTGEREAHLPEGFNEPDNATTANRFWCLRRVFQSLTFEGSSFRYPTSLSFFPLSSSSSSKIHPLPLISLFLPSFRFTSPSASFIFFLTTELR